MWHRAFAYFNLHEDEGLAPPKIIVQSNLTGHLHGAPGHVSPIFFCLASLSLVVPVLPDWVLSRILTCLFGACASNMRVPENPRNTSFRDICALYDK